MKNKILIIFFSIFFSTLLKAENISVEAKNITIDKKREVTIFENEVFIKTNENNTIKADYAEYNKKKGFYRLKKNITVIDSKNNIIETNEAEYFEKDKTLKSIGKTKIITSEKYTIESKDIIFNGITKNIRSNEETLIFDLEKNEISLENFEYLNDENIFKSVGLININDKLGNSYQFSQIFIDTKKKEILGTDIKAYVDQKNLKVNEKNKPRIFSNSVKLKNQSSEFNKSIFTLCDYRENDACPPWSIQASKMLHNNKKKTVYYDNAVIKVYNIPIFYLPKLSHPDPTVERRSGFLIPTISDTKNLGLGVAIPYFWAVDNDKNFTITNTLYASENPLFLGGYHQAFKNSDLIIDFGYTEGYKKTSTKKKKGEKSHFFSKFVKNFDTKNGSNTLNISLQDVSNDKYLKLYKIKSNLVDYNKDTLESSINFSHENENLFFGLNASVYETLKEDYNDKYEFIIPEITLDKNLFSNDKFGYMDLQTNFKVHNYDTNKLTSFFTNNLNWNIKKFNFDSGFRGSILGNLKNINYESKNVQPYKDDFTSEVFGALGYLTEVDLQKTLGDTNHLLKPKFLLRYSPGTMRKENSGYRLTASSAFDIDRLNSINNFETGLSGTIGVDYKVKSQNKEFDFSIAQIISDEENKKMHSKTSLDEKMSDLVGTTSFRINENVKLNYDFSLDQNLRDLNYNEIGANIDFNVINVDFNYLEESKHIGNQEYVKTKLNMNTKNNGIFSFETKRNLITNSAEFYNMSYEYVNDCLRAGLVYRREFYNDSELEPENSLMFKITLVPFGSIDSPAFN